MKTTDMKKRSSWALFAVLVFGTVAWCTSAQASDPKITSIQFKNSDTQSVIEIRSDSPVTYDENDNKKDKQIVIDLTDASLSKTARRKMDTSSFDSKVMLISPYQLGAGKGSRVVVQLRHMETPNVTQDGNLIKISVPNSASSSAEASSEAPSDLPPADTSGTDNPQTAATPVAESTPEVGSVTSTGTPPTGMKDQLAQFIDNRKTGRFSGKPITLKVRDADLVDVFRLISEASGFNIVLGQDVKGKITLSLQDVPWDQALDVILKTQRLGAERNHNVLQIVTLANLTQEKKEELAAKLASEASAPRVTRVFPINYANITDLVKILKDFSSNPAASATAAAGAKGGASAVASSDTVVQTDPRTNSIIVRDTEENVERMHKLIQILDTQTPQVMIEGKVIEATEAFAKNIGGELGLGKGSGNGQYFASFSGADPIDPLFSLNGQNAVFPLGGPGVATSSTGGAFGLSPSLAFLPGSARLNALLNLSESENSVRIVSSPKAVVMDKQKATIVQSTPVLVLSVAQTVQGPVSLPVVEQANLSLDVTPTVTNEGSVLMQLSLSRDIPYPLPPVNGQASSAVANRNITTKVLVDSGSTLVMGGIYTMDQTKSSSGFPILRKIPILGTLFGQDSKNTNRSELFFFITPRILNLKESGIAG